MLKSENILGGVGVVNTLDLDQAGGRASGVARALVAQVTSPIVIHRQPKILHKRPCRFRRCVGSGCQKRFRDRIMRRFVLYRQTERWICWINSLDVYCKGRSVSEFCPKILCTHRQNSPEGFRGSARELAGRNREGTHICDRLPKAS